MLARIGKKCTLVAVLKRTLIYLIRFLINTAGIAVAAEEGYGTTSIE